MMNQGLVSFIVPIYKAERYIHKCIDSLLAQTYTDIEVILVDDGSPDNCGVICDDYAARDKRVKVIHQQNGGVSAARNRGLSYAAGEYVAFVDADDLVTKDYIEELFDNNADLVIGGYKDTGNHTFALSEEQYVGKEALIEFYSTHFHRLYSTVPWGKLYKWSIIQENKLSFDTRIRLGEDLVFNLRYLQYCSEIRLVNATNYLYTTYSCTEERYNLRIEEIRYTLEQMKEHVSVLSEKWNINLSCKDSSAIVLATYPMKKILSDSREYEILYAQYVIGENNANLYERLYSDNICSPVIRGIRLAKMYVKSGQYVKALHMMRKVKKKYGKIMPSIRFSRYDKVVALLCRCFF